MISILCYSPLCTIVLTCNARKYQTASRCHHGSIRSKSWFEIPAPSLCNLLWVHQFIHIPFIIVLSGYAPSHAKRSSTRNLCIAPLAWSECRPLYSDRLHGSSCRNLYSPWNDISPSAWSGRHLVHPDLSHESSWRDLYSPWNHISSLAWSGRHPVYPDRSHGSWSHPAGTEQIM